MIDVNTISATFWSPKLGSPGDIVADLDDIDQCISIILGSPRGCDPHRPLFACDILRWIDRPVNIAVPNIIREAINGLTMWEPRIIIIRVTAAVDLAQTTINVVWQPKTGGKAQSTVVTIGPAGYLALAPRTVGMAVLTAGQGDVLTVGGEENLTW